MIKIITDGSFKLNTGRPFGVGSALLLDEEKGTVYATYMIDDYHKPTAPRSELLGLLAGIRFVDQQDIHDEDIIIVTDSENNFRMINNGWLDAWKRNKWKDKHGNTVANKDLLLQIDKLIESLSVGKGLSFISFHIKGHVLTKGVAERKMNALYADATIVDTGIPKKVYDVTDITKDIREISTNVPHQNTDKFDYAKKRFDDFHGFLPEDEEMLELIALNTTVDTFGRYVVNKYV